MDRIADTIKQLENMNYIVSRDEDVICVALKTSKGYMAMYHTSVGEVLLNQNIVTCVVNQINEVIIKNL